MQAVKNFFDRNSYWMAIWFDNACWFAAGAVIGYAIF